MTWIAARRRYPQRGPLPNGRRRPGRPAIRAHVVGVWAMCQWDSRLYPAWHRGRTLVTIAGIAAKSSVVLLEMDSPRARPDWQTIELKKRLRREGFRDVQCVDREQLLRLLMRRNLRPGVKREYLDPARMTG